MLFEEIPMDFKTKLETHLKSLSPTFDNQKEEKKNDKDSWTKQYFVSCKSKNGSSKTNDWF